MASKQNYRIGDILLIKDIFGMNSPTCTLIVDIDYTNHMVTLYKYGSISIGYLHMYNIKPASEAEIILFCNQETLDLSRIIGYRR